MVIFAGGKFCEHVGKTFHVGGNFHDISHISLIKSYGFYFPTGEIFTKKAKSRKTRKLPQRENFHIYSYSTRLRHIGITLSVVCLSVCPSVRLSVCPSVTLFCHTFQSYVSQATHAFLGMLPLFLVWGLNSLKIKTLAYLDTLW